MFNVVKAELRKLRRPTLFFGTIGSALFFTGLITSFIYLMIDSPQGNGDRGRTIGREALELASGSVNGFSSVGNFLGIIALCVFAAQTAQEYTYGTLRNLLVRQPGRLKILFGKLISMMLFALVMITIAAIVSIAISYFLAPGAKVNTELWFTSDGYHAIFTTFVNVTISVVAFGIIGMILGLLLRSPISAISLGVLWLLIVENLLIAVKSSLQNWLPGAQLTAIASGGAPSRGTTGIEYSHALLVGGIYVGVGAIIASVLFLRRDVAN
jgi:ABC-type transport system involved in multi-copper enzyme maturation permease subunit